MDHAFACEPAGVSVRSSVLEEGLPCLAATLSIEDAGTRSLAERKGLGLAD